MGNIDVVKDKLEFKRISKMDFNYLVPAKNRDELRQWLNDRIIQIENNFADTKRRETYE